MLNIDGLPDDGQLIGVKICFREQLVKKLIRL